jgi:hypothetical protein
MFNLPWAASGVQLILAEGVVDIAREPAKIFAEAYMQW